MYNDFAQAMVSNMTQRMDPMNRVVSTLMEGQATSQKQELLRTKTETIEIITAALEKAKASSAPVSVIEAYERLLNQATAV